jgi:hypothetical protein
MAKGQSSAGEAPGLLAQKLLETLARERVIPRFVDSYVVENGRHALQVHAPLYRDLLAILQREALLAACVRALEIASFETIENSRGKQKTVVRKGADSFRRKFLSALARQQNWNAGDALDFQSDLKMYEDLLGTGSFLASPTQALRSGQPSLRGPLRLPAGFRISRKSPARREPRAGQRSRKSQRSWHQKRSRNNNPSRRAARPERRCRTPVLR